MGGKAKTGTPHSIGPPTPALILYPENIASPPLDYSLVSESFWSGMSLPFPLADSHTASTDANTDFPWAPRI